MEYSNIIKRRIRKGLSKYKIFSQIPYLLESQISSYNDFLQINEDPKKREFIGLHRALSLSFPIIANQDLVRINYRYYECIPIIFNDFDCKKYGFTYSFTLLVKFRIFLYKYNKNKEIILSTFNDQEINMGEIPMITSNGSFIINGIERVIVSQLHKSPGLFLDFYKFKSSGIEKKIFLARIVPHSGSWVDIEFDSRDVLYIRLDKKIKLYITTFFKAIGFNVEKILDIFYTHNFIYLKKNGAMLKLNFSDMEGGFSKYDIFDDDDNIVIKCGNIVRRKDIKRLKELNIRYIFIPEKSLTTLVSSKNIYNKDYNIICSANSYLTEVVIKELRLLKVEEIKVLYINYIDRGPYISSTLRIDETSDKYVARAIIYKVINKTEYSSDKMVKNVFKSLFLQKGDYDLSKVGRMKLNKRLGRKKEFGLMMLEYSDIIDVTKIVIKLRDGRENVDDIDDLGNRRIRCVGELIENQFYFGISRISHSMKDRINKNKIRDPKLLELMNTKLIPLLMKDFFNSSQLSQFMDQINPLSEMTHKRRISSLGPGGLVRDRAGFDVRDVHNTHYGRVCPIETPEGPNIGLIGSMALYAKVNKYGFIEVPYCKVEKSFITNNIEYLDAFDESKYYLCHANASIVDSKLIDNFVSSRYRGDIVMVRTNRVDYIDVSPLLTISIAASLIPFLEHNDANRALMGSNMQRQAVSCIVPDDPMIGTGMEKVIARDSNSVIYARRSGIVSYVDSSRIAIIADKCKYHNNDIGIDIYRLTKFVRSNQDTVINQRSIVNHGDKINLGDVIADGSSTNFGELSLGQNILVAFMPWNGYNFEDSILMSEKIIQDDKYTSIHIEELSLVVRDTRFGPEEVTRNLSFATERQINKLDKFGIINIGEKVESGDILVGKVTPISNHKLTPEEILIRTVFNQKILEGKDTSLRVPAGSFGTVIDVQFFVNDNIEADFCHEKYINDELFNYNKHVYYEFKVFKDSVFKILKNILVGSIANSGPNNIKCGEIISESYLNKLNYYDWFNIVCIDKNIVEKVNRINKVLKIESSKYKNDFYERCNKIFYSNELPFGIFKKIRVYLATKRGLQVGDKMSGRHGNKGVVSKIAPIEDMPYMADGRIVDVVLNPLSIPSRMNVGQILEVHLGFASYGLGLRILSILNGKNNIKNLRKIFKKIYNDTRYLEIFDVLSDYEILKLAGKLKHGVPFCVPVFNSSIEKDIFKMLNLAFPDDIANFFGMTKNKHQVNLYDGRTGRKFDKHITVGYIYYLKLNHLVDNKIHARSTGPYSLVTQQPLGGRAQYGGQRFGEMEVWALEAYGASHLLREILTVKSDDIGGRSRVFKSLVKGRHIVNPNIPESFNVLIKEIRSLGIDMSLKKKNTKGKQNV